jgi:hypothetical protein
MGQFSTKEGNIRDYWCLYGSAKITKAFRRNDLPATNYTN